MNSEDPPLLAVNYDSSAAARRLLGINLIPIILIYVVANLFSGRSATSEPVIVALAMLLALAVYGFLSVFLILAWRRPTFLSVTVDGILSWRPAFSTHNRQLKPGTIINVREECVEITPAVPDLPVSRTVGQNTLINLPSGVLVFPGKVTIPDRS